MTSDAAFLIIGKYLLIAVGIVNTILYAKLAWSYRKEPCGIIKLGISIMGFYWGFYYIQSFFTNPILVGHQVFVRVPLFLTLVLFTALGILSLRKLEK
jgi:hypothetical protein